jgi:hypothetical protein
MKVSCPKCRTEYDLPDEYLGKKLQCANCDEKFFCNPTSIQDVDSTKIPPIVTPPLKDIQINKPSATIKNQQQVNSIENQQKTISIKRNEVKTENNKPKFSIKKDDKTENEDKSVLESNPKTNNNAGLKLKETILLNNIEDKQSVDNKIEMPESLLESSEEVTIDTEAKNKLKDYLNPKKWGQIWKSGVKGKVALIAICFVLISIIGSIFSDEKETTPLPQINKSEKSNSTQSIDKLPVQSVGKSPVQSSDNFYPTEEEVLAIDTKAKNDIAKLTQEKDILEDEKETITKNMKNAEDDTAYRNVKKYSLNIKSPIFKYPIQKKLYSELVNKANEYITDINKGEYTNGTLSNVGWKLSYNRYTDATKKKSLNDSEIKKQKTATKNVEDRLKEIKEDYKKDEGYFNNLIKAVYGGNLFGLKLPVKEKTFVLIDDFENKIKKSDSPYKNAKSSYFNKIQLWKLPFVLRLELIDKQLQKLNYEASVESIISKAKSKIIQSRVNEIYKKYNGKTGVKVKIGEFIDNIENYKNKVVRLYVQKDGLQTFTSVNYNGTIYVYIPDATKLYKKNNRIRQYMYVTIKVYCTAEESFSGFQKIGVLLDVKD